MRLITGLAKGDWSSNVEAMIIGAMKHTTNHIKTHGVLHKHCSIVKGVVKRTLARVAMVGN